MLLTQAALQAAHRCTPAPCGMPAAPATLPTVSVDRSCLALCAPAGCFASLAAPAAPLQGHRLRARAMAGAIATIHLLERSAKQQQRKTLPHNMTQVLQDSVAVSRGHFTEFDTHI